MDLRGSSQSVKLGAPRATSIREVFLLNLLLKRRKKKRKKINDFLF